MQEPKKLLLVASTYDHILQNQQQKSNEKDMFIQI